MWKSQAQGALAQPGRGPGSPMLPFVFTSRSLRDPEKKKGLCPRSQSPDWHWGEEGLGAKWGGMQSGDSTFSPASCRVGSRASHAVGCLPPWILCHAWLCPRWPTEGLSVSAAPECSPLGLIAAFFVLPLPLFFLLGHFFPTQLPRYGFCDSGTAGSGLTGFPPSLLLSL